jgi:predicted nucleic acid-binding protein
MSSFFDSNVLVYLADPRSEKSMLADQLVEEGGLISVQVLNEFANAARRKLKMSPEKLAEFLDAFQNMFEVVPVTVDVHRRAMEFAFSTNFSIFDSNIIAAAELAGCDVLYTEDMNHGQRVGRVMIHNPFVAA